jgi:hypothetical protein
MLLFNTFKELYIDLFSEDNFSFQIELSFYPFSLGSAKVQNFLSYQNYFEKIYFSLQS